MTEELIQEPVDEPMPQAAAEPMPEPAAAEQPQPEPEPEVAPQPAPQPEPVVAPQPQPAAEAVLEPAAEAAAEPALQPEAAETPAATAPEGDDLDAAIAQAADLVESEPATEAAAEDAAGSEHVEDVPAPQFVMPEHDHAASRVSWWPFIVYDVFWVAFAGFMVWRFQQLPADVALYDSDLYPAFLLGGIVLTIAGPLLIFAAWFASWGKPGAHKGHLFVSALIRGAIATAIGVTLWWGAILVLDQLRLGAMI